LSPALRDFSSLPIDVFVVPVPAKGVTTVPKLRRTTALAVESTLVRPTIEGRATQEQYVQAVLPRDLLSAGVDVVAERKVKTADGLVATQTRCRVGANEAATLR
jgi:hypothetical protein